MQHVCKQSKLSVIAIAHSGLFSFVLIGSGESVHPTLQTSAASFVESHGVILGGVLRGVTSVGHHTCA